MCCVYLGTGIYLIVLEFRSVTSRYAAVSGGVTSEGQKKGSTVCNEHMTSFAMFSTKTWNSDLWGRPPSGAPWSVGGRGPPDLLRAD